MSAPMDPMIEAYLSYLAHVRRQAPRTMVDVRCTLRRVMAATATRQPGVALWRLQLRDFLHWLEQERHRGSSPAGLAKCLSHVRGLLDYAWRSGCAERNVLDGFSLQHTLARQVPKHLTLEEAELLVRLSPLPGAVGRRDRLIVLLLYGCGLRTSELCALDASDINRERQELTVRQAKGDRPRCIPIPDGLYTELLAYLLEHGQRGALLRTQARRKRITAKDVCQVITTQAVRAGLRQSVTARTLRHSFATHLMDRGVDLAVIASLMGHRSPQETGVYLHVLPQRPQAAVRALSMGEPK